jgi:hypothetical protein
MRYHPLSPTPLCYSGFSLDNKISMMMVVSRVVHNHPSGDPTPSKADIEMTREVANAARLMGIEVHDHLIIGRGKQTSLRGLGLIYGGARKQRFTPQ